MRALLLLPLFACAARDAALAPGPPQAQLPVAAPLSPPDRARHHLVLLEDGQPHASAVARAPFACAELVPSWNVRTSEAAAFLVELSVAGADERWSSWLVVGAFGLDESALEQLRAELARRTTCELGRIDVDTLVAAQPFDRARLRLVSPTGAALDERVVLERAAFAFTAAAERPAPPEQGAASIAPGVAPIALEVAFRSQRAEASELAARICSPTALAMVLAFHGVPLSTAEVAARAWDPLHDIYGNWSRAIQTAAGCGLAGHVARFSDWAAVRAALAAGTPLVASVRALPGELPGAPVPYGEGHLIVITGLDGRGNALVNDPACADERAGRTRYPCAALERVWFERRRGTAYVIEPARARAAPELATPAQAPPAD